MTRVTEFFGAVAGGDLDRVEALLQDDHLLARASNQDGVSAVLWAAYHRQTPVVERLIADGMDLNVFEAAAVGDRERVRILLEEDSALVESDSADGFSPLGLAAFFGNLDVVGVLLASGADPNVASRNAMQVTPLHSAAAHQRAEVSFQIAEALLRAGADPNVTQQGGWTPLHQAAAHGREELVQLLLAHGADVRAQTASGETPAHKAAEGGHRSVARRLQESTATDPA